MGNMRFKVGDRVRIKSLDWYNENKNKSHGTVACGGKYFDYDMREWCGKTMTIFEVYQTCYLMKEDGFKDLWTDEMIEGLVEEEKVSNVNSITQDRVDKLACKIDEELPSGNPYEWECREGYIFKDENGNVINATKIVLEKKKEYPKTYEECCKIMQVARPFMWFNYSEVNSISQGGDEYERHMENTLCVLRRLLICRDAYWKIAGEEMGLGKLWEPNWKNGEQNKFCIYNYKGSIKRESWYFANAVLSFPTEEIRDTFYENFKELIEECKELL